MDAADAMPEWKMLSCVYALLCYGIALSSGLFLFSMPEGNNMYSL